MDAQGDQPLLSGRAIADAATRRAIAFYALRAFGFVGAGFVLMLAASLFLTEAGDTKPGYPEILPEVCLVPAILLAVFGGCGVLNVSRVVWGVSRNPWRLVSAEFDEVAGGHPNGQPVLFLADGHRRWVLTVSAMKWKWGKFDEPQLLLAAREGHGGVVATADRRVIGWAGRSLYSAWLLRLRGGGSRRRSGGRH